MSNPGWYPDPSGQPGMYRYWTGTEWTTSVTPDPSRVSQPGSGGGATSPTPQSPGFTDQRNNSQWGWWLGGLAAVVAVVVAVWFLGSTLFPSVVGAPGTDPGASGQPGSNPTQLVCPPADNSNPPTTGDQNGWITGGKLAYPTLGDPWTTGLDNRVPFGPVATVQTVLDQDNFDGAGSSWVASVLVSDLFIGDGFASTKQGAEIILKCVLGTYYADTVVTQSQTKGSDHPVDGHPGWLIETTLSFNIPGLKATSEDVLLLVVQTGDNDYGLFYASIPNTLDYLMADARTSLDHLKVTG